MTLATPYSLRLFGEFRGDDGVGYRFEVRQAGYAGPVTEVRRFPREGGVVVPREAGHPLAPTVTARCTLRWKDGGASYVVAGLPYGQVQGVLRSDLDGDGTHETVEWAGYLVPDRFSDVPGDPDADTELGFNDGRGLLTNRLAVDPTAGGYNAERAESIYSRLATWLAPLASADGVLGGLLPETTWSPVAGSVTSDAPGSDPSGSVLVLDGAFVAADGEVALQDYAVRSLASALGARLFQCPPSVAGGVPSWRLIQRSYAATGALDPFDTLDLGTAAGLGETDASVAGVRRERDVRVTVVGVHREFAKSFEDGIANGSFEDGTGTAADGWTQTANAFRYDLANFDPAYANRWGLAVFDDGVASQDGFAVLSAGPTGRYRFAGTLVHRSGVSTAALVSMRIGDHPMRLGRLRMKATLKGEGVVAGLEYPVLKGPLGGPFFDSDARLGVEVIPAGATLHLYDATNGAVTFRVTRAVRIGDVTLTGDLSDSLSAAATYDTRFLYWGPPSGVDNPLSELPYEVSTSLTKPRGWDALTFPHDCQGAPVTGRPRTVIDGGGNGITTVYDDLRLAVAVEGGRPAGGSVHRASSGAQGAVLDLPVSDAALPVGDGPLPTSPDRVLVSTSGGPVNTGLGGAPWVSSAFYAVAPSYQAPTLGDLLAADVLAQLSADGGDGRLRRWVGRLLLRGGARYTPDRSLVLYHPDGAGGWAGANYWWDRLVWDVGMGTLDVEATELALTDPTPFDRSYLLTT